uniref:Uncharacterized protein n=1 Tax=Knipowitschia caucasica TaxID=637954 RepID=A0AAV2K2P4_KNICA
MGGRVDTLQHLTPQSGKKGAKHVFLLHAEFFACCQPEQPCPLIPEALHVVVREVWGGDRSSATHLITPLHMCTCSQSRLSACLLWDRAWDRSSEGGGGWERWSHGGFQTTVSDI